MARLLKKLCILFLASLDKLMVLLTMMISASFPHIVCTKAVHTRQLWGWGWRSVHVPAKCSITFSVTTDVLLNSLALTLLCFIKTRGKLRLLFRSPYIFTYLYCSVINIWSLVQFVVNADPNTCSTTSLISAFVECFVFWAGQFYIFWVILLRKTLKDFLRLAQWQNTAEARHRASGAGDAPRIPAVALQPRRIIYGFQYLN